MAIKGKKKKSGGKPRTSAPRRAAGKHPPAFLARRWVQLTSVGVAALLVGFLLAWAAFGGSGNSVLTAEGERHVTALRSKVDVILFPIGSAPTPTTGGASEHFSLFPQFTSAVVKIKPSDALSPELVKAAAVVGQQARTAATAFSALKLSDYAGGLPIRTEDALYASEQYMVVGLQLYEQSTVMIADSASATGAGRTALISHAVNLTSVAVQLFDRGYSAYSDVLASAGLSSLTVQIPQSAPPPVVGPGVTGPSATPVANP